MLFELSAVHAIAARLNVTCLVGWWEQMEAPALPYGDRPAPAPGITLKHIFPNIRFVSVYPSYQNGLGLATAPADCQFAAFQSQLTALLQLDEPAPSNFIPGFFENMRRFKLVHEQRQHIVSHVLAFHPAVLQYVKAKYFQAFNGSRETVSLHFRLGGTEEPNSAFNARMQMLRGMPSAGWYRHVTTAAFNPAKVTYLVVADDMEAALAIVDDIRASDPSWHVVPVVEDFVSTLALMSLCEHHIGTTSTFSFWGAYLDQQQPHGGRTVFPPSFKTYHGASVWPYDSWETIDDNWLPRAPEDL